MRWVLIGVVALLVAGLVAVGVLDHFGLLDAGKMALGGLKRIKAARPFVRTYELGLSRSQELAREKMRLEDARQALEVKAQEIAREGAALAERRRTSEEELAQLEAKRNELLKSISTAERLDRVAKLCAAMSTAGAVKLLAELEEADVAQVLARLPDKQAAAILSGMDAKRAARIVTRLVRQ